MSPITHLLISWTVAEEARFEGRDRAIVAVAGVVADLDGLPVIIDLANRVLGRPESFWYAQLHHWLMHGLPAALVTTMVAGLVAAHRVRVAVFAFLVFHIHLLCDLIGARGPAPDDIWPVYYLAPVSWTPEIAWSGQWKLNAWPNILLTLALLALVMVRAVRRGYSPLGILSLRADRVFVATLRNRFAGRHQ